MQFGSGYNKTYIAVGISAAALLLCSLGGYWLLTEIFYPGGEGMVTIEVPDGSGVFDIAESVSAAGLTRSSAAFVAYTTLSGTTRDLKPGRYTFQATARTPEVVRALVAGPSNEVEVTIIEGSTLWDIDKTLAASGVLPKGALIARVLATSTPLEGKLFPDTYRFYVSSTADAVIGKFLENFKEKTAPLLAGRPNDGEADLIMASLLEREVRSFPDRQVVAGILAKRLTVGMALQVDATICRIKEERNPETNCYPLTPLDFKMNSPYNTYLHKGLPPGPIGNPGIEAIRAALNPVDSPYWFYLSDPKTGKTVFSQTLDRHEENRVKYLLKNS